MLKILANLNNLYNFMPPKIDHIDQNVYLSDWESATDKNLLAHHKISAVICVNNLFKNNVEMKIYSELKIDHFMIDAEDSETTNLKKWFKSTNTIIEQYNKKNQNVLIHCTAGISRSVTIVMAYFIYLIHCKGSKKPNVPIIHNLYKWMLKRRPRILPNPGFYAQLNAYERECMMSTI
jgi:predicted protein tyrosine phosphatase